MIRDLTNIWNQFEKITKATSRKKSDIAKVL